jgi:hypothetical protein
MTIVAILLLLALIAVAISFYPRLALLHRVATILVCIALLVQYVPKGD